MNRAETVFFLVSLSSMFAIIVSPLFYSKSVVSEDPELVDMNDPSVMQPLLSTAVLFEELTTEDELFCFDGAVYTGWAKNRDLSNFCYFKSGKGTIYTKKRGNSLRQQKKKVGKEYLWTCYNYRTGKRTNEHYMDVEGNILRGTSWNDNGEIVSTINEGSGVRTLFMLGSPIQQHYRNGVKVRDDLLGVTEKK
jgi:hypothetical protein